MFRKLLKTSGVDFFFATTCNAASGQLWEKLGGSPAQGAFETYTLMIRPRPSPRSRPYHDTSEACPFR